MTKHRSDIDGLRAVAVLAVVLYHCGLDKLLPGGFAGVDVFFVLSGYLITNIILSELNDGRFSIIEFYSRRARRILPAAIVMYIGVMVASLLVMLPHENVIVFQSIFSSAIFVSNFYFYSLSGYFDQSSEFNPALHTWSLSVEEQFYIFFPIVIIVASKLGRKGPVAAIFAMTVISLAAAAIAVKIDQSAAFYMVHFRAWELLVGSVLATGVLRCPSNSLMANTLAVTGAGMVAASFLLLSKSAEFPGLAAVPVCAGTALIILTGPANTLVSRLLSIRLATAIGLISYSLYLWHWPIWVYLNQISPWEKGWQIVPVTLSVLVAVVSWRFVEQPFRKKSTIGHLKTVLAGGSAVFVMCAVTLGGIMMSRHEAVANPAVNVIAEFGDYDSQPHYRSGKCFLTAMDQRENFDAANCLAVSATLPDIALIGDSHAAHLFPGLAAIPYVNVLQATSSGCKPLIGTLGEARCVDLMDFVFSQFLPKARVDVLILAARWQLQDLKHVLATVEALEAHADRVVVIGPVAEYRSSLPRLLAKSIYNGESFNAVAHLSGEQRGIDTQLRALLVGSNAEYVSIYDAICTPKCTVWTRENEPLLFDYGHFTADGSREIVSRISASITP